MKKVSKRVLSVLLASVMLIMASPFSALSDLTKNIAPIASAKEYAAGDIIEFGFYPQTLVTDETLIDELNSIASSVSWQSLRWSYGNEWTVTSKHSNYGKYKDVIYEGEKYRQLYFTKYRPYTTRYPAEIKYSEQDESGYYINTAYWFKYEPIKWRILDPSTGLVISDLILDAQEYHVEMGGSSGNYYIYGTDGKQHPADTYYYSEIRPWLNETFYSVAFSEEEEICIDNVILSDVIPEGTSEEDITTDRVFLISFDHAESFIRNLPANQIPSSLSAAEIEEKINDPAQFYFAFGSDYAKACGIRSKESPYGCSTWGFRTTASYGAFSYYGASSYTTTNSLGSNIWLPATTYPINGIRPAIYINFDSYENESIYVLGSGRTSFGADNHVAIGETYQLKAYHFPSMKELTSGLTWYSSDPAVVSVNNNGIVTGKSEGYAYIYAISADGVKTKRGYFIYVADYELTGDETEPVDVQQDNDRYILSTRLFAENTTMPESFGFYNKVWNNENGRRLGWVKSWEIIGDIGEIATFKFNDLEISADYYDLFLSDIILKLNEQEESSGLDVKAMKLYDTYYKQLHSALKSTEQWQKSVVDGSSVDLEIKGFLTKPDFKCSENTYRILESVFGDLFTKHRDRFTDIFDGFNVASQMCDYITSAADIVKAFRKAYHAYIVTQLYQEVNSEYFTILYRACSKMENRTYAKWFKNNIDKYFALAMDGNPNYQYALTLMEEMSWMTYDKVFKGAVKNLAYQGAAKLLNVAAGGKVLAGEIAITAFAYSTTYGILDKVLSLDGKTKAYEIMNYVAPVEKALCSVENDYANILIGRNDLESAQNYEFFYGLYRSVNLYLYQAAYSFCSTAKLRSDKEIELKTLTAYIHQWKQSSCTKGSRTDRYKYTGVHCPVDIYVYDDNGIPLLEIKNEQINQCDDSITAMVFDGKKSVVYPADQNYTIDVVSREEGVMSYYVSEIIFDTSERQLAFYDIPLASEQLFSGDIPSTFDIDRSAYELRTDETRVPCDYDSKDAQDCTNGHTVTDWHVISPATCAEEGEQCGYCNKCGKRVYELIEKSLTHGSLEKQNKTLPTCMNDGYSGDYVCTICGKIIKKGKLIAATGHVDTDRNGTCDVCGERLASEPIDPTDPVTPSDPVAPTDPTEPQVTEGPCKYCGKPHDATFLGRLVAFFHTILYFFAHLFGKM